MPAPDPLGRIQEVDAQASEWASGHLAPTATRPGFEFMAGQLGILVFAPIALIWIFAAGKRALRLAIAAFFLAALCTIVAGFIAILVKRTAPDGSGLYSFPSAIAADAAGLGVFFSLYYIKHAGWILPVAILWAIAPVATRHVFPGDAVAGVVLGFFLGTLAHNLTRRNIGRYDIFVSEGGTIRGPKGPRGLR